MQIGDGAACIIRKNGNKLIPIETIDENQFGGRTNSLSSSNCLSLFRYFYSKHIPKAIIVASDGVVDSYAGNNGMDFLNFCSRLTDLFTEDYNQAQGFLDDWLPQLSEKGSQDDMSVAGIYLLPKRYCSHCTGHWIEIPPPCPYFGKRTLRTNSECALTGKKLIVEREDTENEGDNKAGT